MSRLANVQRKLSTKIFSARTVCRQCSLYTVLCGANESTMWVFGDRTKSGQLVTWRLPTGQCSSLSSLTIAYSGCFRQKQAANVATLGHCTVIRWDSPTTQKIARPTVTASCLVQKHSRCFKMKFVLTGDLSAVCADNTGAAPCPGGATPCSCVLASTLVISTIHLHNSTHLAAAMVSGPDWKCLTDSDCGWGTCVNDAVTPTSKCSATAYPSTCMCVPAGTSECLRKRARSFHYFQAVSKVALATSTSTHAVAWRTPVLESAIATRKKWSLHVPVFG